MLGLEVTGGPRGQPGRWATGFGAPPERAGHQAVRGDAGLRWPPRRSAQLAGLSGAPGLRRRVRGEGGGTWGPRAGATPSQGPGPPAPSVPASPRRSLTPQTGRPRRGEGRIGDPWPSDRAGSAEFECAQPAAQSAGGGVPPSRSCPSRSRPSPGAPPPPLGAPRPAPATWGRPASAARRAQGRPEPQSPISSRLAAPLHFRRGTPAPSPHTSHTSRARSFGLWGRLSHSRLENSRRDLAPPGLSSGWSQGPHPRPGPTPLPRVQSAAELQAPP